MHKDKYFDHVERLMTITGKRIGHHVYVHMDAVEEFSLPLKYFIDDLVRGMGNDFEFNVVKLSKREFNISLLNYPDFYKKVHPALTKSCKIDLHTLLVRIQSYNYNRPILHRTEFMMSPNHPLISKFMGISTMEEVKGLYDDTKIIGREVKWEELVRSKNFFEELLKIEEEITTEEK